MNPILQRLIDMDQKKRLHHGFLFATSGDFSRIEARDTAFSFVSHVLAKGLDATQTEISQKKIANKNHPDFFLLASEDAEIKIEEIREMQRWLSISPLEAEKKIVLIQNAQDLSPACANALLKTLEEPPPFALLILITNSISRILPTVRSRLFGIQFPERQKIAADESMEWMPDLYALLSKKSYTDKEIFSFTERLTDKRTDLVYLFDTVHQTIRNRMLDCSSVQFNKLEKIFNLTLDLEQQLYQNYGNISLGLDRFFMEWRNT